LDILLHLAQYGNELLLVTGPEGSGKTTMLNQFMKKIGEDWQVCQINAHNMLTEEQLLSRVSRGFQLPEENGPIGSITANLKRRLDAMLATHQTVVIAVDNAHVLSTEALNLLLEFATIRNISKGIAVRILLFSEPQIKIQLASPELQSRQTLPIRKIDLPPFDEQQTGRLIRHRVTSAGLVSKHVFNDAIISKIYKYSQGWPGLITEIAHQVLFESTPLKRRDASNKQGENESGTKSRRLVPIVSALLVATGLASVLVFQDQINALFTSGQSADKTNQNIQNLAIPGQSAEKTAAAPQEPVISKPEEPEEQEFPVINVPPQPSPAADQPTSAAANNIETGKEQAAAPRPASTPPIATPETMTTMETTAPSLVAMPEHQDVVTPAQSSSAKPESTIPLEHQEDWIMSQSPDHFTLQVVAGYQESTVVNFIAKQPLPSSELAYYYSLNRGKDWHSLIFGSYPNRDQAMGAAVELSKHLKHVKPWIRPFKSVQDDIRYARSHS
jgi:DamX protein